MKGWNAFAVATLAAALGVPAGSHAAETFDVSAYEKKPWEAKGYVEGRGEALWLDTGRGGYALQFPGLGSTREARFAGTAEVSGIVRHDAFTFNATGRLSWLDDVRETTRDARFLEAYATWTPAPQASVEIGKRALRWGKGYAWSPLAFLERPKDPLDPELSREGYGLVAGEVVRSFADGLLQTAALSVVALPVTPNFNETYGPAKHANPAAKVYLLAADTDIDIAFAGRGSHGQRYGVDFSRNVTSNVEVHGEWARAADISRPVVSASGTIGSRTFDASSWLAGVRYLSEAETTVIAEIYRNGAGYGRDGIDTYYRLVGEAVAAGDAVRLSRLRQAGSQGYTRPNAGRTYGYLRVSQKDPFDWLYVTPALTVIGNLDDRSLSIIPELTYTGFDNVELRLRAQANVGGSRTEYGEKAIDRRVELRVRVFF